MNSWRLNPVTENNDIVYPQLLYMGIVLYGPATALEAGKRNEKNVLKKKFGLLCRSKDF